MRTGPTASPLAAALHTEPIQSQPPVVTVSALAFSLLKYQTERNGHVIIYSPMLDVPKPLTVAGNFAGTRESYRM